MLLYFLVQAINKYHEGFLFAWVGYQVEPPGEFPYVLFDVVGFLPDSVEMSTVFDVRTL